jgi:hypothetical protein
MVCGVVAVAEIRGNENRVSPAWEAGRGGDGCVAERKFLLEADRADEQVVLEKHLRFGARPQYLETYPGVPAIEVKRFVRHTGPDGIEFEAGQVGGV